MRILAGGHPSNLWPPSHGNLLEGQSALPAGPATRSIGASSRRKRRRSMRRNGWDSHLPPPLHRTCRCDRRTLGFARGLAQRAGRRHSDLPRMCLNVDPRRTVSFSKRRLYPKFTALPSLCKRKTPWKMGFLSKGGRSAHRDPTGPCGQVHRRPCIAQKVWMLFLPLC